MKVIARALLDMDSRPWNAPSTSRPCAASMPKDFQKITLQTDDFDLMIGASSEDIRLRDHFELLE